MTIAFFINSLGKFTKTFHKPPPPPPPKKKFSMRRGIFLATLEFFDSNPVKKRERIIIFIWGVNGFQPVRLQEFNISD